MHTVEKVMDWIKQVNEIVAQKEATILAMNPMKNKILVKYRDQYVSWRLSGTGEFTLGFYHNDINDAIEEYEKREGIQ